jgi:nucleotide-binding universal stress UspA family protein
MSYKTILVHADPGEGADDRVKLAVDVAAIFDAKVIGLAAEGYYSLVAAGFAAEATMLEMVRERIAEDLPLAEKRFRSLTSSVAAGVEWITGYDNPAIELAQHAHAADLIVASRPPRGTSPTFAAPAAEVVMGAGAPVLLTPSTPASFKGENVVVAWKNTRESRRAIADALPLLMRAHKVTVTAVDGENSGIEQAELDAIVRRLARHGVEASSVITLRGRGTVSDALELTAAKASADLIVMGAYGHSRFQEWVLGGVTEDLVAACSRFVLFSH